ncbi:MAG: metallophosphoesterase [Dorea sp.]|nr:metallophosphoesterase [Dorea sp.]
MYLKTLLSAAALPAVLLGMEIFRELHHFRVVTYKISSKKLEGMEKAMKLVFLSDLHNQIYGKGNKRLLQKIREADPALILIGGDMLVGRRDRSYQPALSFVTELSKLYPVYYANGNHEQRMKEWPGVYQDSFEEYKGALLEAGVHFLENDSQELLCGRARLRLTGLEIPAECYSHFKRIPMPDGAIEERIGEAREADYEILLAHNPAYVKEYLAWGADLVLSGHLHGGIVRFPGGIGAISPSFALFPRYSGDHYREGEKDIVVSKGLGVHTVCVRLFNPAEVVVLELSGSTHDKDDAK